MKKWEYRKVIIRIEDQVAEEQLDQLGAEGWELINIFEVRASSLRHLIFKREKQTHVVGAAVFAFTIKDTAAYLQVHDETVRGLLRDKKLKHYRLGSSIRIRKIDIDKFIEDSLSDDYVAQSGPKRK